MTDPQRDPRDIIGTALCVAADECGIEEYEMMAAQQWLAERDAEIVVLRGALTACVDATNEVFRRVPNTGVGVLRAPLDAALAVLSGAVPAPPTIPRGQMGYERQMAEDEAADMRARLAAPPTAAPLAATQGAVIAKHPLPWRLVTGVGLHRAGIVIEDANGDEVTEVCGEVGADDRDAAIGELIVAAVNAHALRAARWEAGDES